MVWLCKKKTDDTIGKNSDTKRGPSTAVACEVILTSMQTLGTAMKSTTQHLGRQSERSTKIRPALRDKASVIVFALCVSEL